MGVEIYDGWGIHQAMLRDSVRNEAFGRALRAVVRPGSVVIDAGAGTGILSALAVEAGAARVYAIEQSSTAALARQWLQQAGHSDQVTVIESSVSEARVPEPADVIVSEWLGTFGVDENLLPMALLVRDRWLRPGGTMIPGKVSAKLALVNSGRRTQSSLFHEPLTWIGEGLKAEQLLSAGASLWTTDTHTFPLDRAALPFRSTVEVLARDAGTVDALTAWFEAELTDGVHLSNRPGEPLTHWGQFLFHLAQPIPVRQGDALTVKFDSLPAGPGFSHYAWSVRDTAGRWQHNDSRLGTQALQS